MLISQKLQNSCSFTFIMPNTPLPTRLTEASCKLNTINFEEQDSHITYFICKKLKYTN